MLVLILTLFATALLLGVYLISFVLQNKNTPKGIAFLHGPIAATALVLLVIYSYIHTHSFWISVILFVLAAVGGFILIFRDLTGKSIPKWLALAHGILGLLGFSFLLFLAFS